MSDQIVSVSWLDPHQTAAAFATRSGRRFVLPKGFLPHDLVASPCYSVRTARYANEEHTALIARTFEAGDVAVSKADTPAMWEHIHSSGIRIAPFSDYDWGSERSLPAVPEGVAPDKQEQLPNPTEALPGPIFDAALLGRAAEASQSVQQAVEVQPQQHFLMRNDAERREAAKKSIDDAVLKVAQEIMKGRVRFEVALEAKNERVDSMAMLEEEAKAKGVTVRFLAEQIIAEQRAKERRMIGVGNIQRQAFADIDAASGDAIDAIANVAIGEIAGAA